MTADTNGVNRQSFIVRIWLEQLDDQPDAIEWRGQITHVASGDGRHVRTLGEIADFMASYVAQLAQVGSVQSSGQ